MGLNFDDDSLEFCDHGSWGANSTDIVPQIIRLIIIHKSIVARSVETRIPRNWWPKPVRQYIILLSHWSDCIQSPVMKVYWGKPHAQLPIPLYSSQMDPFHGESGLWLGRLNTERSIRDSPNNSFNDFSHQAPSEAGSPYHLPEEHDRGRSQAVSRIWTRQQYSSKAEFSRWRKRPRTGWGNTVDAPRSRMLDCHRPTTWRCWYCRGKFRNCGSLDRRTGSAEYGGIM